ncbi:MAG: hypothetical protein ACK54X_13610 [Burkholderiales bacterium]|jgi:hypothetical protein
MGTIEGIRKHGFRKWYERQLIESHAWLVTLLLAVLTMAAGLEALSFRDGPVEVLFDAMVVVGGAALSWIAWRRYASTMLVAEHVGRQAVCPRCERYGFRALPPAEDGAHGTPMRLVAACARCGHRWPIDPAL